MVYASGGSLNIPYSSQITVNPGPLVSGSLSCNFLTPINYSATLNLTGMLDQYNNAVPVTVTCTATNLGVSPSNFPMQVTPDSNGNASVSFTINSVGKYTFSISQKSSISVTTYAMVSDFNQPQTFDGTTNNEVEIHSDGTVWSFGYSTDGILGLGSSVSNTNGTWMQVTSPLIHNAVKIMANGSESLVLDSNGNLWFTGSFDPYDFVNNYTLIANNVIDILTAYYPFTNSPTYGDPSSVWYIKSDGTVWYIGAPVNWAGTGNVEGDFNGYTLQIRPAEVMLNSTTPFTEAVEFYNFWYAGIEILRNDGTYWWTDQFTSSYIIQGTQSSP
jgi:hypothetical protein